MGTGYKCLSPFCWKIRWLRATFRLLGKFVPKPLWTIFAKSATLLRSFLRLRRVIRADRTDYEGRNIGATLTREQILFFLTKFRELNPKLLEHRLRLLDRFANAVYLYDDRLTILFNCKDGNKTSTFTENETAQKDSGLSALAVLRHQKERRFYAVPRIFQLIFRVILHCIS